MGSSEIRSLQLEYSVRDIQLFNLGIGCKATELKYTYENDPEFGAFPTFGVIPSFAAMGAEPLDNYLDNYRPVYLLHGEQYLELHRPLPVSGQLTCTSEVVDLQKKGSGSVIVIQVTTKDADGQTVCVAEGNLFIRKATPKAGVRTAPQKRRPLASQTFPIPDRAPDAVVKERVGENQAAVYRLSGDYNPLHIDPAFAKVAGFERPILHGLCSYGIAARHVLQAFGNNDPKRLRFSKHVFPGDDVQTEMWRVSPTTVAFQLRVLGRDDIAISQAFVELQPDGAAPAEPAGTGAGAVSIIGGLQRNLEKLPSAARRGLVQRVKGVFAFQLDTAAFTLDMKNGDGAVIVGRGPSPDVTITVSDENFAKLAAGKLSGKDAFMTGAVKIKGNLMLSVKMDTVLKTLSGNVASKL